MKEKILLISLKIFNFVTVNEFVLRATEFCYKIVLEQK